MSCSLGRLVSVAAGLCFSINVLGTVIESTGAGDTPLSAPSWTRIESRPPSALPQSSVYSLEIKPQDGGTIGDLPTGSLAPIGPVIVGVNWSASAPGGSEKSMGYQSMLSSTVESPDPLAMVGHFTWQYLPEMLAVCGFAGVVYVVHRRRRASVI